MHFGRRLTSWPERMKNGGIEKKKKMIIIERENSFVEDLKCQIQSAKCKMLVGGSYS